MVNIPVADYLKLHQLCGMFMRFIHSPAHLAPFGSTEKDMHKPVSNVFKALSVPAIDNAQRELLNKASVQVARGQFTFEDDGVSLEKPVNGKTMLGYDEFLLALTAVAHIQIPASKLEEKRASIIRKHHSLDIGPYEVHDEHEAAIKAGIAGYGNYEFGPRPEHIVLHANLPFSKNEFPRIGQLLTVSQMISTNTSLTSNALARGFEKREFIRKRIPKSHLPLFDRVFSEAKPYFGLNKEFYRMR